MGVVHFAAIDRVIKNPSQIMMTGLYFVLLFFGLLLGDGKQGVIEVFSASVIIILWGTALYQHKPMRVVPSQFFVPWLAFGAVSLLSTVGSDSVGHSVSWLVRLICGYLVYRYFFSVSSIQMLKQFAWGLLLLVGGAGLLFIASRLGLWIFASTPPMSLVSLKYGHSHFADLLIIVLPFVYVFIFQEKISRLAKIAIGILYIVGLLLTFSRGAFLIAGVFVGYKLMGTGVNRRMLIGIALCVGLFFLGLRVFSYRAIDFKEKITRPLSTNSRTEYWRQALAGIKERPMFGSGPGTFSLTSVRFQKEPGQFSWFTHSEPLQIASELGLLGLGAYLLLFFSHVLLFYTRKTDLHRMHPHAKAAVCSTILVFLYSIFEFILDFNIVWLLFWSVLGLITGLVLEDSPYQERLSKAVVVPLVCIVMFYMSWILSAAFMIGPKRYDLAYLVAPYDTTSALMMLENSQHHSRAASFFVQRVFKNDPKIIFAVAKMTKQYDMNNATLLLKRVIIQDPQNVEYFSTYIDTLVSQGAQQEASLALGVDPSLSRFLKKELFVDMGRSERKGEYFAKLYYFLGLAVLPESPQQTKLLWTKARDLLPWWGHFSIELAGLYKDYLRDPMEAKNILRECEQYESPREQCHQAQVVGISPVGSLASEIRLIPGKP